MTATPLPPPPLPQRGVRAVSPRSRSWWGGVATGASVPGLAFAALWMLADVAAVESVGSNVWGAVAFLGVFLLALERTRRYGVGILVGFSAVLLVVAETRTGGISMFG